MIQVLSLMATHSEVGTGDGNLIRGHILVQQAKKVHTRRFIKPKSRIHAGSLYTKLRIRRFAIYQVGYTCSFMNGKERTCRKAYFWSVVVSPRYLSLCFWTKVSRQTCWSLELSWWYWVTMVLDRGIVKGLNLYKEKITRPKCVCVSDEYLMKCEIQMLVMGWWSEPRFHSCGGWWMMEWDLKAWDDYLHMVWLWID